MRVSLATTGMGVRLPVFCTYRRPIPARLCCCLDDLSHGHPYFFLVFFLVLEYVWVNESGQQMGRLRPAHRRSSTTAPPKSLICYNFSVDEPAEQGEQGETSMKSVLQAAFSLLAITKVVIGVVRRMSNSRQYAQGYLLAPGATVTGTQRGI